MDGATKVEAIRETEVKLGVQPCFIACVRHGERADFVEEKFDYDIPFDPILTPNGVQ